MTPLDALLAPALLLLLAPMAASLLSRLLWLALPSPATESGAAPSLLPMYMLEAALGALSFVVASGLLGPALVARPAGPPSIAFALLTASLTLLACVRQQRRYAGAASARLQLSLGAAVLLPLALASAFGPWPVMSLTLLALGLCLAALVGSRLRRTHGPRPALSSAGIVLACTLAGASWAAAGAFSESSRIASDATATTSGSAARTRVRLAPWDGDARLALAWEARRSGHLERAEALAELAVRLNADAAATLDFFAELAAARGDCRESYARFETALRVRAAEAFTGVLERPLRLGLSALPPSYIARCLEGNPDPADDQEPTQAP
ncbi:MAG: hypothetical protein GXP55_00555 [Deltaproteobacteria bacterium]|nr:hypothetical protein [Deltaproteobacteria bacterium]